MGVDNEEHYPVFGKKLSLVNTEQILHDDFVKLTEIPEEPIKVFHQVKPLFSSRIRIEEVQRQQLYSCRGNSRGLAVDLQQEAIRH